MRVEDRYAVIAVLPDRAVGVEFKHPIHRFMQHGKKIGEMVTIVRQFTNCNLFLVDGDNSRLLGNGEINWDSIERPRTFRKGCGLRELARKITLSKALKGAGLSYAEREILWNTYLHRYRFQPERRKQPDEVVIEATGVVVPTADIVTPSGRAWYDQIDPIDDAIQEMKDMIAPTGVADGLTGG